MLARKHGLDVSVYSESLLEKSLARGMAATASPSPDAYLNRLEQNRTEAEAFVASLNISYSEFFRNPLAFALLEHLVLPQLVSQKSGHGELRVWSAGCAGGQEPYSMAILLDDMARTRQPAPPNFRIFATDLSEAELAVARLGVYDAAATQNVRLKHLRNCFVQHGESYAIVSRLKERIEFSIHDLLDRRLASPSGSIYGDFDVVLCCNLLFYYRAETQKFIVGQLCRALSRNGFLVTGEAERAIVEQEGCFQELNPPAGIFRKIA